MIAWREASGDDRMLVAVGAASVGAAAMLAVVAAPLAPALARLLPACAFHALTGVPCPACGSTRAGLALLAGDPLAAFALNPLFTLGLLAVGAFAVVAPVWLAAGGAVPRFAAAPVGGMPRALRLAAFAALGAQWAWLVVRST